jgi:hypothetical protein
MNNWCICLFFTYIFTGDFIFKGSTARRLYKSFGVKELIRKLSDRKANSQIQNMMTLCTNYRKAN